MTIPALFGVIVFIGLPFVLAFVFSFTNLRMGSPLPVEFVGLEQYRRILDNPSLVRALLNNGIFAVIVVPVQTALALALAIALNRQDRRA
jgi:multiple sugar transport system permease protein